jgi:hypothetical protein
MPAAPASPPLATAPATAPTAFEPKAPPMQLALAPPPAEPAATSATPLSSPTDVAKASLSFPPPGFGVVASASRLAAFAMASTSVGLVVIVAPERDGTPGEPLAHVVPRFYWSKGGALERVPRLSAGFPPVRVKDGAFVDPVELLEGPGPALFATVTWIGEGPAGSSYSEIFRYAKKIGRWTRAGGSRQAGWVFEHPTACRDSVVVVSRAPGIAPALEIIGGSRTRPVMPGPLEHAPDALFGFPGGELVAPLRASSGELLILRWAPGRSDPVVQTIESQRLAQLRVLARSASEILVYAEPRDGGLFNAGSGQVDLVTPPPPAPRKLVFDGRWWNTDDSQTVSPLPGMETLRGAFASVIDVSQAFETPEGDLLVVGRHEGRSYLLSSRPTATRLDGIDEGADPPAKPNARGPAPSAPGTTVTKTAPRGSVDWGI